MHGVERTSASEIVCTARANWGSKEKFRAPRGLGPSQLFFYPPKVQILYNSLVMKYFQSQEILTTTHPPPGRKVFDDEWICPPRNYCIFFCPPPVQVWEALP